MRHTSAARYLSRRVISAALAGILIWTFLPTAFAASVRIPVFSGTNSESWESYEFGWPAPEPLPFLGGLATIYEASPSHNMVIYEETYSFGTGPVSFGLGPFPARVADGNHGFGNSLGGGIQGVITLTKAATAFGGYWAHSVYAPPITFQFLDADGAIVGSDSFLYSQPNNNGTLEWVGWQFSSPVHQILYSGTFIVNDALQFNLIPEPSVSSILLVTAVAGMVRRCRTGSR